MRRKRTRFQVLALAGALIAGAAMSGMSFCRAAESGTLIKKNKDLLSSSETEQTEDTLTQEAQPSDIISQELETQQENDSADDLETAAAGTVTVNIEAASQQLSFEDGTCYFTSLIERPVVSIEGASQLADAINNSEALETLFAIFAENEKTMAETAANVSPDFLSEGTCSGYEVYLYDTFTTPGALSLRFSESSYQAGAAHPMHSSTACSFDLRDGSALTLDQILEEGQEDAKEQLVLLFTQKLEELFYGSYDGPSDPEQAVRTALEGGYLTAGDQWCFSREGLVLFFPPYAIASYAAGVIEAVIPYDALDGILKAEFLPD